MSASFNPLLYINNILHFGLAKVQYIFDKKDFRWKWYIPLDMPALLQANRFCL
ncbi:MAG: hypothetical protein RL235_919 [Chlamydiota bacterium]|jgi:hypothetical protein